MVSFNDRVIQAGVHHLANKGERDTIDNADLTYKATGVGIVVNGVAMFALLGMVVFATVNPNSSLEPLGKASALVLTSFAATVGLFIVSSKLERSAEKIIRSLLDLKDHHSLAG